MDLATLCIGVQEVLISLASNHGVSHIVQRHAGGFGGLGLKTIHAVGFLVWTPKPGADSAQPKAGLEGTWRHHDACVEAKQRNGMSIR